MKYLKTYRECNLRFHYNRIINEISNNESNMNDIMYIGTIYTHSNNEIFKKLGYNTFNFDWENPERYIWIQIDILNDEEYGTIIYSTYNLKYDLLVNISEIPKRENLEEYVKYIKDSNKMGLL